MTVCECEINVHHSPSTHDEHFLCARPGVLCGPVKPFKPYRKQPTALLPEKQPYLPLKQRNVPTLTCLIKKTTCLNVCKRLKNQELKCQETKVHTSEEFSLGKELRGPQMVSVLVHTGTTRNAAIKSPKGQHFYLYQRQITDVHRVSVCAHLDAVGFHSYFCEVLGYLFGKLSLYF